MMAAPVVSICLPCFRPGGMDILFSGLRDQTFKDFELILVDARYEKRHDAVMKLAEESGVRTIHVPEHRRNGKWVVVASAWNTAFMLARGEYLLMMPDYCYVPPDWISNHLRLLQSPGEDRYVLAPYTFLRLPAVRNKNGDPVSVPGEFSAAAAVFTVTDPPGDDFDEISIFYNSFEPSWLANLEPWAPGYQCPRYDPAPLQSQGTPLFWHIHFRNESVPRRIMEELQGLDEQLDRGKALIDSEFGRRIGLRRVHMISDPHNRCFILNPRTLFPTMPGFASRWDYKTCENYALNTQSPMPPHPYSWRQRSAELAAWREAVTIETSSLDVPDEAYYYRRRDDGTLFD